MRPIKQRVSSATWTDWVPLDLYGDSFNTALALLFSTNKNLTVSVEYTHDSVLTPTPIAIAGLSRVTTSLTVPITSHGLAVGDSVVLSGFGAPFDGNYRVTSVTDENNVVVTVANSGATSAPFNAGVCVTARVLTHSVLNGQTSNADSNFSAPVAACRLRCTSYTAGYCDLIIRQGALAI